MWCVNNTIKTLAPSGVIEGVGTGDYKMSFDIKLLWIFSVDMFAGAIEINTDNKISVAGIQSSALSYLQWHSIEIERVSGTTTIKVDRITDGTGADTTDWSAYDAQASSNGFWDFPSSNDHASYYGIKNFKFYKNSVLVVDLPLESDLTDNCSLTWAAIDPAGYPAISYWDDMAIIKHCSEGFEYYPIIWDGSQFVYFTPQAPGYAAVAGDSTLNGATKMGTAFHFPISIPAGSTIDSAKLLFYLYDMGGGMGLGGASLACTLSFDKDNASTLVSSVEDYNTRTRTASIAVTGTYTQAYQESGDIKTGLQEAADLGEISALTVFLEDRDDSSGDNNFLYIIPSGAVEFFTLLGVSYSAGVSTYTVTYDGNGNTGGSVPVDASSPYDENDTVTVLGNTGSLVKTGYTFDGWNTAADGSGTDYAPAATFQMPASNTTLYAQWAAVPLQKAFCRKSEKIFQRGF